MALDIRYFSSAMDSSALYALDGKCCKNEDKLIPFIDEYFLI